MRSLTPTGKGERVFCRNGQTRAYSWDLKRISKRQIDRGQRVGDRVVWLSTPQG